MSETQPTFIVEIPDHRRAEREYALSVLLADWLHASYRISVDPELRDTRLRLASDLSDVVLTIPDILLAPTTTWLSPESLPAHPLPVVDMPEWTGHTGPMPLLFAAPDDPAYLTGGSDGRIALGWDLLGALVFMLARYEEYVKPARLDIHDRFPSSAMSLVVSGWHQYPVCDMYLHVFAAIVRRAWPGLALAPDPYEGLHVGHDVDHPSSSMLWHGSGRVRVLGGDVIVRRDPLLAVRRASAFMPWAAPLAAHDPLNTFDFLMTASERAGVASTFFFLTDDTATPAGSSFRVCDPWAARLISEIGRRGHFVALHGSYNSGRRADQLAREWGLLADACRIIPPDRLRRAIRQHYLRWTPGETWRAQADAGLLEDETLAFADTIGYRAGTARSYPAFDLGRGLPLPLRVKPLHVMDAALSGVSASPDEADARAVEMERRTREYGGAFSILWHNSRLETPRVRRRYSRLLAALGG